MDVLADVLDRVRFGGTLLFHFELGHPWSLALPNRPYALFHYLSEGTATLALEQGGDLHLSAGDFVVITRGEKHLLYSDRSAKPFPLTDIERPRGRLGVVRHGGDTKPIATMICGNFTVARPLRSNVLDLLPPVLLLRTQAGGDGLDALLKRMVSESTSVRPGQDIALSRLTELLFVEVLRSWIASLPAGEGGWLGAMGDPHIGPALQLIHEHADKAWTLQGLGDRVGLGRSVFSARFTKLVGQPMQRYLIARRMEMASSLLESSDEAIARIARRVGYETSAAFSKLFHRHYGLSPGRYRAMRRKTHSASGQARADEPDGAPSTSTGVEV